MVVELGRTKKGKKAAGILNLMKGYWMNVGNRSNLVLIRIIPWKQPEQEIVHLDFDSCSIGNPRLADEIISDSEMSLNWLSQVAIEFQILLPSCKETHRRGVLGLYLSF